MYKIEKIDGDIAMITTNDQTLNIDRNRLPADAQEGDELDITTIATLETTTETPIEMDEIIETAEAEIEES